MLTRFLAAILAVATGLVTPVPESFAARDLAPLVGIAPPSEYELIVIEAPGCIYCRIFRRDVLPGYEASPRAKALPLRFVDVNEADADALELSAPINIVPTVLLVQGRKELSRITGYTGPENFFHSVNHMLNIAAPEGQAAN